MKKLSRRVFLKNLAFNSDKSASNEGRVLVTIFLRGGADTLNMFVPYADHDYYKQRPTIAIAAPNKAAGTAESAIKLDGLYALHPRLKPILPIYQAGRMAVVQAVGCDNPTGSHFDTQDQIEHGTAYGQTVSGGWLGRHLRTHSLKHQTPLSAISIGTAICESLGGAPSVSALQSIDEIKLQSMPKDTASTISALTALYGAEVGILSQPGKDTLDLLGKVQKMHSGTYRPAHGADYGEGELAAGLREIARLIKANVGLQVACIDFGGWDTHFVQGGSEGLQAENINLLGKALAAFDADLAKHRSKVTTVVMTEFGRRTYENGSFGTDHGQGSAVVVMGGGVRGGKFYGAWPGVTDQETDLLGPSGLRVKLDYRSVLAEVLSGMMHNHHIEKVFPKFNPTQIGFAPQKNA